VVEVVERLCPVAGGILDGEAGDASRDAAANIVRDAVGIVGIAGFEIGIHRQVCRRHDVGDMAEHGIARHRPVGIGQASGKGETGARRR
jgi:hypothetical protein